MRVLIAPDKFRGTFTAAQVCEHIGRGVREASAAIEVVSAPLADGGEGTLECVLRACGGTRVEAGATGPLGDPIEGEYAVTPDGEAVIEAARFCGLQLLAAGRLDPMRATSLGLGQAIAAALDAGVRRFLIGLGGTATVDGGAGMARALGYRLEDAGGAPIASGGAGLAAIRRVDASMAHPAVAASRFTALCDVDNPLIGPRGAAAVFGPQKGAGPGEVARLEAGLLALAAALAAWKGAVPADLSTLPSGGAAGGLGLGCALFLGADLAPGAARLMEMTGFAALLERADLVVTGEGSFDSQSGGGKVTGSVLAAAAGAGRPAVVVAGRWDGSLPAVRPADLEILTPATLSGRPGPSGPMNEADLAEAGRRVAARLRRLAKPHPG